MSLKDIVTLFKNHQIQYGLNGDSENQMQELYKWELVSKQNGHPDPNVVDFLKRLSHLILAISASVLRLPQLEILRNMNQKSIENSLEHCLMKTPFCKKELKTLLKVAKHYGMIRSKQNLPIIRVQCVMSDLSVVS